MEIVVVGIQEAFWYLNVIRSLNKNLYYGNKNSFTISLYRYWNWKSLLQIVQISLFL